MKKLTPFHVAVPVYDLQEARQFYRDVLGCEEGRSSDAWVDFDLFGHQFVIHLKPRPKKEEGLHSNPVDGHMMFPSSPLWRCTGMGRMASFGAKTERT